MSTIIEFLKRRGYTVDNNPMAKISKEYCELLEQEYKLDKNIKDEKETNNPKVKSNTSPIKIIVENKNSYREITSIDELVNWEQLLMCLNTSTSEFEEKLKELGLVLKTFNPTPIDSIYILPSEQLNFLKKNEPLQEIEGLFYFKEKKKEICSYVFWKNATEEEKEKIIFQKCLLTDFAKKYSIFPKNLINLLDAIGIKYGQIKTIQKIQLKYIYKFCEIQNINFSSAKSCIEEKYRLKINIAQDVTPLSTKTLSQLTSTKQEPTNSKNMALSKTPIQKIIFGSPGTGKSYAISGKDNSSSYLKQLGINSEDDPNCIKTVFHPEYTYGDFMGKLLPLTDEKNNITYNFYEGHFLKSLAQAYKNYINKEDDKLQNVVLVIDEINRGNSAAIFGTAFQLLDRDMNGFSEYEISISKMEYDRLITLIFPEFSDTVLEARPKKIEKKLKDINELSFLMNNKIKIPPNMHIIATMNTSDNSIYFMDSAFKRRWDWQFIDVTSQGEKQSQQNRKLEDGTLWSDFVDNINEFIKTKCKIRKVEDKQIGYYFIKGEIISKESIENKLMFFLWDSVFNNEKRPLEKLLNLTSIQLVTFGDFVKNRQKFIDAIKTKSYTKVSEE